MGLACAIDTASWTTEANALADAALGRFANLPPRTFRFGPTTLAIDCDVSDLDRWLDEAFADCVVATDRPADLYCRARMAGGRLIALSFSGAIGCPPVDLARILLRPRHELRHLVEQHCSMPGWRQIGDPDDPHSPLIAGDATRALIDLAQHPDEFLINLVVGMAQRADPAMLYLHAGGAVIDGRGVLMCGRSGAGKSTTTTAVASRGHALLGDEIVGLDVTRGALWPFRKTIKLRPGPLPSAVRARLQRTPNVVRVDPQGLGCTWVRSGELFATPAPEGPTPLDSLFFLRAFRDIPAVERFTPDLADLAELQTLTQSLSAALSWPSEAAPRLLRYARLAALFSGARCYHFDLGSPEASAELIERTVLQPWD